MRPRVAFCLASTLALFATTACERTLAVETVTPSIPKPMAIELPTDETSATGWYPAIALDKQEHLHIAYCDSARGDLRYGFRGDDGVLRLETVAAYGAVGKYVTLAVDDNNAPHLMYFDQDNQFVKYTTKQNGVWLQAKLNPGSPAALPDAAERHEKLAWGPESGIGGRLVVDKGLVYAMYYVNRKQGGALHLSTRKSLSQAPYGSQDAWHDEVIDKVDGSFSIWTDLRLVDGQLYAMYPTWNFVSTELRLAKRPVAGGDWTVRVLYPLSKKVPGWNNALIPEDKGFTVAFTTLGRERFQVGPLPPKGDIKDLPVLGYFINKMRLARAPSGDLIATAAETGRGRLGNSQLAIYRRHDSHWTRYVVDDRRPVASQMDLAVNAKGQAIVLYWADIDRGLWLYDETGIKTQVQGARPSPAAQELQPKVKNQQPAAASPGLRHQEPPTPAQKPKAAKAASNAPLAPKKVKPQAAPHPPKP